MGHFILFTLSYIVGMALAVLFDLHAAAFFLLLTVFLLVGAAIPFWQRHAEAISEGSLRRILREEEAFPVLSVLFLMAAMACFGIYRYAGAIYAVGPRHLDRIMENADPWTKWRVVGEVIEEPNLKGDYLEVKVKPRLVQKVVRTKKAKAPAKGRNKGRKKKGQPEETPAGSAAASGAAVLPLASEGYVLPEAPPEPEVEVDGGLISALIYQETEAYRQVKFDQTVELIGQFNKASSRRNPGSLDYQKYLRNQGVFRTFRHTAKSGRVNILAENPSGAAWYRFALHLRTEFLKVIKQTMPYPESSFLGGVMLGLKGGLPPIVGTEFRKTGVSHVLAVSGLHVTIIAALFYGIFTMFRVPARIFAPIIVFFLFTFALIVGWPSSAVRAALMNSLFVLSRAYLKDYGFRMSIIFSLAVAAAYILSMSPLQLTEPSFVLSFMAIYALAMFTDPAEKLLRDCLRGNGLLFAAVASFLFYGVVIVKRDLVIHPWFFQVAALYIMVTLWASRKLAASSGFGSYSFEMLPAWLKSFTASQVSIFLAMMGPLSAFYFGSISLASPMANMIAIPLIGVIVQLGMVAAIIGAFVPVVGLSLALLLNAANWLGVKFFLGMAHFFAVLIPFPRVSQPGIGLVLLYYLALHLFFYWDIVTEYAVALRGAVAELWEDPDYKLSIGLVAGLFLAGGLFLTIFGLSRLERQPSLRLTMLDVGFGSALLLEKGGRAALIDAGMRDGLSEYDVGERVTQPALSEKFIDRLDTVILTTALPERVSGLMSIADSYQIGQILAPFDIPADGRLIPFQEFVKRFSFADMNIEADFRKGLIPSSPPSYYYDQAFQAFNALIKRVYQKGIPVGRLMAGRRVPGFEDTLEVLYPDRDPERFSVYYDGAILQVTEGNRRFVYSSGSMYSLPKVLPEKVDVLFLADLPFPLQEFWDLLAQGRFQRVALSWRKPSSWLMEGFYMKKILDGRGIQVERRIRDLDEIFFQTQTDGAIQVDVRKDELAVKRFIPREGKPDT